ncbi:unannotated protein [freshwater metagenome]|uniref:Unannotated protein n=1 Tax=freshwater metagenome TaxID=449393 RepID=A0A6J6F972_9ZZZZ
MTTCRFRISVKVRRFSFKKAIHLLKSLSTKLKPVSIRALSMTSRSIRLTPMSQTECSFITVSMAGAALISPTFSTSRTRFPTPRCCCSNRTIAQRKRSSMQRMRLSITTCRVAQKNSGPKPVPAMRSFAITPMMKPMKRNGWRINSTTCMTAATVGAIAQSCTAPMHKAVLLRNTSCASASSTKSLAARAFTIVVKSKTRWRI